jgi:hypothetical protein
MERGSRKYNRTRKMRAKGQGDEGVARAEKKNDIQVEAETNIFDKTKEEEIFNIKGKEEDGADM